MNPTMEHRGHVDGVAHGAAGDQLREGRLDIQANGLRFAECREQRTVRLACTDGVDVGSCEPGTLEQCVPAIGLGLGCQRQVLG